MREIAGVVAGHVDSLEQDYLRYLQGLEPMPACASTRSASSGRAWPVWSFASTGARRG